MFFVDYDEGSASWCVFHTDRRTGHAYSSWAAEELAKEDADRRNREAAHS